MTNYDDGDDNGDDNVDDNGNKYGNDDDNTTSGSGSNGPVFDLITMPRSHGGGLGDDGDGRYGRGALYSYHLKDFP